VLESNSKRRVDARETVLPADLYGVVAPLMTSWNMSRNVDTEDVGNEIRGVLPYVHILFSAGNAGEGRQMDFENWCSLISTVIDSRNKYALSRTPVLAGVLRSDVSEIASYSRMSQELGADGIVIAPMLGPDPEKVLEATLQNTDLAIVLYSNPSMHKDLELPVEFVRYARDSYPNRVIGIKVSTKNSDVFRQMLSLKTNSFKVLQGNTADGASSLNLGTDGIVPVEACIYPKAFRDLYETIGFGNSQDSDACTLEITKILADIRSKKSELSLSTLGVIKSELVKHGVFKSSRMYEG
jgi:dihydrodipicolinate synthase/N-acetylneuraminate lyase